MTERYPLVWPEGWPRTLIGDRQSRGAWKKNGKQSVDTLALELKRFDVLSWVITRKDPDDIRGAADPSVAVWFSRRQEDDFSWQQALQISDPSPTIQQIETAFKKLAGKYHPDNVATGDGELFLALQKHKERAMAYVNRLTGTAHDFVIACDSFKETKWNVIAIANTIRSLRQMERDGTSSLMKRTMQGFSVAALPTNTPSTEAANAAKAT